MWEGILIYIPTKATMSGEESHSQKRGEIEPLEKKTRKELWAGIMEN